VAGKLFPLVILPRLTTLVGAGTFRTLGMDVAAFEGAILHVWRSDLLGVSPQITLAFEESDDQVLWTECDGGEAFVPTANAETMVEIELRRRYVRATATLSGNNIAVSLAATGHLVSRSLRRETQEPVTE
jgi:hypothetical protein